jgi:penicillin-binding protein 1C
MASVKLMGLRDGSRLRAAPGQREVKVTLDAVGGSGKLYWLLDGQALPGAGRRQALVLPAGAHGIAVIDAAGHYDALQVDVDG